MSTERSQYGWIQTENIFPSVTSLRHAAFEDLETKRTLIAVKGEKASK